MQNVEKQRHRYHRGRRIVMVSRRQLVEAQTDPSWERRRQVHKHVVCRICGERWKNLAVHLRDAHRLNTKKYRLDWNGAPVIAKRIASVRAANMSRVTRSRRDFSVEWATGELAAQGAGTAAIATKVGRSKGQIWEIAMRLGLDAHSVYDLGKPFTYRDAGELRKACGLTPAEFADSFGIPLGMAKLFQPSRRSRVNRVHAKAVLDARKKIIGHIVAASRDRSHRWTTDATRATRSLIPHIADAYSLLRKGIGKTRRALLADASLSKWKTAILEGVELERRGKLRGDFFRTFFALSVQVAPSIQAELPNLSTDRNFRFAQRVLAAHLGLTYSIVRHAVSSQPLAPREVHLEILKMPRQGVVAAKGESDVKKQYAKRPDIEKEWFRVGQKVHSRLPGKPSRAEIEVARKAVSDETLLSYDTVAEYHRRFAAKTPTNLQIRRG